MMLKIRINNIWKIDLKITNMSYNVLIERLIYLNDLLVEGNLDEKLLSSISNEVKEITEELKTLS